MASQKSSPNRTTTNNLDNPQPNRSSASSGGSSPGRSDKTNSVDDEARVSRNQSEMNRVDSEKNQPGETNDVTNNEDRKFASSDDFVAEANPIQTPGSWF